MFIIAIITHFRTEDIDMKGFAFPIVFKICTSPAFDQNALKNMSYRRFVAYFRASELFSTILHLYGLRSM